MIKKSIPHADLKLLVDSIAVCLLDDSQFQAVYKAVIDSFSVQTRLFKALTDRKDCYVEVYIRRKAQKIILKFSALPESLLSESFLKLEQNKSDSEQALKPLLDSFSASQQVEVIHSVLEPVQPESLIIDSLQPEPKRKGRGKSKKQSVPRSLVSVLIDDTDIELLNQLATRKDSSVSQLIRLAVRGLLERR